MQVLVEAYVEKLNRFYQIVIIDIPKGTNAKSFARDTIFSNQLEYLSDIIIEVKTQIDYDDEDPYKYFTLIYREIP